MDGREIRSCYHFCLYHVGWLFCQRKNNTYLSCRRELGYRGKKSHFSASSVQTEFADPQINCVNYMLSGTLLFPVATCREKAGLWTWKALLVRSASSTGLMSSPGSLRRFSGCRQTIIDIIIKFFRILPTGEPWFFSRSALVVMLSSFHKVGVMRCKNMWGAAHVLFPSHLLPPALRTPWAQTGSPWTLSMWKRHVREKWVITECWGGKGPLEGTCTNPQIQDCVQWLLTVPKDRERPLHDVMLRHAQHPHPGTLE